MMTMQDWVGDQRRLLSEFEQWWQENQKISTVQFPLSLDERDWFEQFAFFCKRQRTACDANRQDDSEAASGQNKPDGAN